MVRVGRNSRISGRARIHWCISISCRAVQGRSPYWLCAPWVRMMWVSFNAFSTPNPSAMTVVSSSRVKNSAHTESRLWNASMNRDRESAPRTGGPGLDASTRPYCMVVLVGPPGDGEPVLGVLDPAPEQVVQRAQRVDVQTGQRITPGWARGPVLEPPA